MAPDALDMLRSPSPVRSNGRIDLLRAAPGPDNAIAGTGQGRQASFGAVMSEARRAAETPRAEKPGGRNAAGENCRKETPAPQLADPGDANVADSPSEKSDGVAGAVLNPETETEEEESTARIEADTAFPATAATAAPDAGAPGSLPVAGTTSPESTAKPDSGSPRNLPQPDRDASAATATGRPGQSGGHSPLPPPLETGSAETGSAGSGSAEIDTSPDATGSAMVRDETVAARSVPPPSEPAAPSAGQVHPVLASAGVAPGHPVAPPPGPAAPVSHGAAVAVPLGQPGFPQALASEVGAIVLAGIGRAEIRLRPQEMGPIHIELTVDADGTRIAFAAVRPDTRSAIEQSLPVLRDMLADKGLMLADAQVSDGRTGAGFQQASSQRHGGARPPDPDREGGNAVRQVSDRAASRTLSIPSLGRLDLYA